MIMRIIKEIIGLPYVIQNDPVEDNGVCIRINDEELTDGMYEQGLYYTQDFVQKLKTDVNRIVLEKANVMAEFLKIKIEHQDKDWFKVQIVLK